MMTNKEIVLELMRESSKLVAQSIQEKADKMTGTELNEKTLYIPDFKAACEKTNMLNRPIGFVCKSAAGRVVKLLQPYDSTIYTRLTVRFIACCLKRSSPCKKSREPLT